MYNLFSLATGFFSWCLGSVAVFSKGRKGFVVSSLILCILALVSQFLEIDRLVGKGDWSAIEDTFPAVRLAATVLAAVTLLLNAAALLRSRNG